MLDSEKIVEYYTREYCGMEYNGNLGVTLLDNIVSYGFENWGYDGVQDQLNNFFSVMLPDWKENKKYFYTEN